jgi:hypothetical protein
MWRGKLRCGLYSKVESLRLSTPRVYTLCATEARKEA